MDKTSKMNPTPKYVKDRINQGTLFLIPTLVLVFLMVVAPLIYCVVLSFNSWNGSFNKPMTFVGFKNYLRLNTMVGYSAMMKFTFFFAIAVTILVVGISLIMAFALDKPQRGKYMNRSVLRALWYLPALIGGTSVGVIWRIMYNYNNGVLNTLLKQAGLQPVNWLETMGVASWAVIIAQVWVMLGMCIIIFLAGMQSIPTELYESATIDGASIWQQRLHIAIPLLAPSITINVVTTSIAAFKAYELPYTITKGLPSYTTQIVTRMIQQYSFESLEYGVGAALSVILVLIIVVIQLIQLFILNKNEGAYD